MRVRKRRVANGMTLVELVIVMVIVSILGAATVVGIDAKNQYAVNTQSDQLRRDLSHVQLLAASWQVSLHVATTSTGYSVTCNSIVSGTPCTSTTNAVTDPATGSGFSVTFTDGVTMTSSSSTIDFDSMGRPIAGTALITANPARTYTLSASGHSVNVYLRPITGFAETG